MLKKRAMAGTVNYLAFDRAHQLCHEGNLPVNVETSHVWVGQNKKTGEMFACWAGDRHSRKSIQHCSSTQGSVALSVGEAEYYALVKGAAEGLGIQALARDLGI